MHRTLTTIPAPQSAPQSAPATTGCSHTRTPDCQLTALRNGSVRVSAHSGHILGYVRPVIENGERVFRAESLRTGSALRRSQGTFTQERDALACLVQFVSFRRHQESEGPAGMCRLCALRR